MIPRCHYPRYPWHTLHSYQLFLWIVHLQSFVPIGEKLIFVFSFVFILLFFFPYPLLVFALNFTDCSCFPGKPKEHSGTGLIVVSSRGLAFARGSSLDWNFSDFLKKIHFQLPWDVNAFWSFATHDKVAHGIIGIIKFAFFSCLFFVSAAPFA